MYGWTALGRPATMPGQQPRTTHGRRHRNRGAAARQAREIAQRQLGEAHTEAALTVFRRLCYEQDRAREALEWPAAGDVVR